MKKRILSLFCALVLCLGLLPATALAAAPVYQVIYVGGVEISSTDYWTTDGEGNVTAYTGEGTPTDNYIHYDADTNTLTLHNATIKKSLPYSTDPPAGSYIPGSAIGVFNQNGDAELTITLEGANTIAEVGKGIYVLANSTGGATLTITGDGSLDASASQTGIWVQSNSGNATLTIRNAKVEATGTSTAGYGVNVQSSNSSTAALTVDGGSLTASGSPGILYDSSGSGTVPNTTALTINNSAIVDARGGGIGAGLLQDLEKVSPADDSVGIVFDNGTGTVYGDATLQENLTIGEGERLDIPSGASLTIDSGATLTNEGTVTNSGTLTNNGKIENSGTLPDDIDGTAPPRITTTALDDGTVNTSYSETLNADGSPTSWEVTDGSLPAGLTLDESTGLISGTPTTAGTSTFTVKAANDYGSDSKELSIIIIDEQTDVPVTGVSLNTSTLNLIEGGTDTLTATVEPNNATNRNVTWSSDNPSVATVNNGVVSAVSEGTATITVTAQGDSTKSASCTVTVTAAAVPVTGVTLNKTSTSLYVGNTETLTATVAPDNATDKTVTWTSSNPSVATVENGVVSAVAPGTAVITVTTADGTKTATCTVTVTVPVTGVTLSQTQASLYYNRTPNTLTLTATVAPDNATNKDVIWTSSDSAVATVDQNGVVTAVDRGTATITITTADGNYTATCTVTVSRYSSGGGSSSSSTSLSDRAIDDIQDARPGDTVEITLRPGRTTLEREVFEELAGQDITLEIDAGDGVLWTVNGLDIPEDTRLHDLDLDVDLGDSGIPATVLNAVTGEIGTVQLSLAHDGEFGFTMTLSAPLGRDNADYWANLYWFNEGTEELEFQQAARIAKDGTAEFALDHASDYAIVIDDRSHEPVDLPFNDVPEGYWAYDAIQYVYGEGLMAGTSGSTFSPEGATTRGQIVTILWRLSGSPVVNYLMDFDDVDPAAYYAEAIRWATSEGIAGGYGGGVFGPNDPITREQLAVMLYQYAWNMGYDLSIGEDTNILSYADAFDVSEYAVSALQWACGAGIISGTGDGSTLSPGGSATRSQVAMILMRFCQEFVEEAN